MKTLLIVIIALSAQLASAQITADSLNSPVAFSLSMSLPLKQTSGNLAALSMSIAPPMEENEYRRQPELIIQAGANLYNRRGCIISTENSSDDGLVVEASTASEKNYSVHLVSRERKGEGVAFAAVKFAGLRYSAHLFTDNYEITRASDNLVLKMACTETCLEVAIASKSGKKCELQTNQTALQILNQLGLNIELPQK